MAQPKQLQQLALADDQPAEAHTSADELALVPCTPPPKRRRCWKSQPSTPPLNSHFTEWCESTFAGSIPDSGELTIVLLGQTGSGKTSFLNLLCNFPTVLQHGQEEPFKFKGRSFIAGAIVKARCQCERGFSAARHLEASTFPADVTIFDKSDPDTCKQCGHHRRFHYHDSKIWVNEKYTAEVVDEECKQKYFEAKGLREKKEAAMEGVKGKIALCKQEQQNLSHELLDNIRQFEQHGLSRNYGMLLQNQRDLLEQHIDATLEGEPGADVSALREAHEGVSKQLEVVQKSLQQGSNEVEWARAMLGLGRGSTREDIDRKHKEEAKRLHPDKCGGNPERMSQLNTAVEILRTHAENVWNPCSWWKNLQRQPV